jgi:hypothetical protein
MKRKPAATSTFRRLERQRDEVLGELRLVSPRLTRELEETLAALRARIPYSKKA